MDAFHEMQLHGHEQVVFNHEPSCGYFGIIAIHDTTLGPSLGGTRVWPYESTNAALNDVLRLSRGMTYKSAVAGLNLGGGKAVIIADPKREDRESLFRAHGRFVESLGGRYITAEDVGTSPQDMEFVKRETKHVAGLLNLSGDPSPVTGYGVYMGMKAAAKQQWGKDSLSGRRVAVQGCGKVASYLMSHLKEEGADIVTTDIDEAKVAWCVETYGARAVAPEEIYDEDVEIFAPCALGGIINDDTLNRLQARVIVGAANNQLQEDRHGRELEEKGFLYAPDYVVNGGGVINVYGELQGWTVDRGKRKAQEIYDTLLRVFSIAKRDGIPSFEAADRLAEERIRSVAALKKMWLEGDR
ncbi:MAG TPA: Glu/Leu/Phe/Val dehydrogenase dimerization domain-containing protein [Gemmatimonadales bacterium]|nr:Glu/Leu/Phe/Val dehydrogenase dimerization domain-containing protein [Gemmatimonadales bacterium]